MSQWIAYLSGLVLIKDGNETLCPHYPPLEQSQKAVKTYFSNNLLFIILALQNSNNLSYCLNFYTTKRDYSRYLFRFISRWERDVCLNIKILQMFSLNLTNMVILTHLKLWIGVARHNLKWMNI